MKSIINRRGTKTSQRGLKRMGPPSSFMDATSCYRDCAVYAKRLENGSTTCSSCKNGSLYIKK